MQTALNIVSTSLIGLLVGTELTVSAFINPVLVQVGGIAEAQATRLFAKRLGAFMPFWYAGCLILLIAQAVMRRGEAGGLWIEASIAVWLLVVVLTLIFLVPINNRLAKMEPEHFGDALREQHSRWDILHRGRVAMLALAMVCMLIGVGL
ncbi:MAG TPA: DUF1772 domain-containing protein [Terracidiphilus sp.]|jgi:uncharacterized membrane protein